MAVLIEICADSDAQRQGSALSKLSTDFKGLLASLIEVGEAFTCCCQKQYRHHISSGNLQFNGQLSQTYSGATDIFYSDQISQNLMLYYPILIYG